MDKIGFRTRDLGIMAASIILAGGLAGVVSGRSAGQLKPFSDCEVQCLRNNPNDTEKRLNCMLNCIADGKFEVQRVLAIPLTDCSSQNADEAPEEVDE